jgi:hypothetical protein
MLRLAAGQLAGGPGKWAKGDFHVDGGSCALGAIQDAMGPAKLAILPDDFQAAQATLLQTLKDMHPELTATTIPDLNDDPAVTYEDVVAAFEKAALIMEERVSGE